VYAAEEIKKDVEEFTKIAIEDKISKIQIHNVFHPIRSSYVNHWSTEKLLKEVKEYSDREIAASEIIGRTIISKRFAEKILFIISKYIISKYHQRPHDLKLLIHTAMLLYNDQKQVADRKV
jgi:wyosine [tRNA(Phe)-imidazoG37] synthetase (radical SAM superfamily)